MPFISFLDPSVDLDFSLRILEEIEKLAAIKESEVKKDFEKWEKENDNEDKPSEWYRAQVDNFSDEWFFVSELKRNLFNGLAVTISTIFETYVHNYIRETYKRSGTTGFKEKHTYTMREFKKILKKSGHPNKDTITLSMWRKLRVYAEIRNCIVHHEGFVHDDYVEVRSFVEDNKQLFVRDENLWIISVTGNYIRKKINDINEFFKILVYYKNGTIIYD